MDWLADVTGEIAAELKAKNRPDLRVFPGFGTYFYSVNCQPKLPDGKPNPLADPRVRRALAMSLDKQAVIDTVTRMGEKPADTYVPPGIFKDYPSPPGIPDDVAAARKLLADAGYPGGRGFPKLTILFNKEVPARRDRPGRPPAVAAEPRHRPSTWKASRSSSSAEAARQGLRHRPGKLVRRLQRRLHLHRQVPLHQREQRLGLGQRSRTTHCCTMPSTMPTRDPEHRLRTLSQAEQILCDEAPIIPIYFYNSAYLFRDNVKGIPLNPRMMLNFKSVYVAA